VDRNRRLKSLKKGEPEGKEKKGERINKHKGDGAHSRGEGKKGTEFGLNSKVVIEAKKTTGGGSVPYHGEKRKKERKKKRKGVK